jgi:tripartite-type tricarboxylate transporter receptor subunit TctC
MPRSLLLIPVCLCCLPALPAGAQAYPTKAVRLIVPSSPGSGFDVIGAE